MIHWQQTLFWLLIFISLSTNTQAQYVSVPPSTAYHRLHNESYKLYEGLRLDTLDGKFGFKDSMGQTKIKHQFDYAFPFKSGHARIIQNGKWGLIDHNGKQTVAPQYDLMFLLKNNQYFAVRNEQVGVISDKNEQILPFVYQYIFPFKGDYFKVAQNKKWGVVNSKNEIILPCNYRQIDEYSDSLWVLTSKPQEEALFFPKTKNKIDYPRNAQTKFNAQQLQVIWIDSSYHLINSSGEPLKKYPKEIHGIFGLFENEPCVIYTTIGDGRLYGMMNPSGKIVVQPIYKRAGNWFYKWLPVSKNGKQYGLIDIKGKEVVPCEYEKIKPYFSPIIGVCKNGGCGFITDKNRVVVPLRYDDINYFGYHLYAVKQDGKWTLRNQKGKKLSKTAYTHLWMQQMTFPYLMAERDSMNGYIDTLGREVVPCDSRRFRAFTDALQPVKRKGKWGLKNTLNEIVIDCKYDSIGAYHAKGTPVKFEGKWGFFDDSFQQKIDFIYDETDGYKDQSYRGPRARVKQGDEVFYIDSHGERHSTY